MRTRALQTIAISLAALPALAVAAEFARAGVGADPIKTLTHATGEWGLRFVLISLAVTPLRRIFGWSSLAPLRRTFGLAGFAYAVAHLLIWSILDLGLDPAAIAEDLSERPYVMVGMAAFLLLAALAATSTRAAMKRLGRRWITLHRAVYAAALLAVVHHFWLVKADYRPPILHAGVLALLLAARLPALRRERILPPRPAPDSAAVSGRARSR